MLKYHISCAENPKGQKTYIILYRETTITIITVCTMYKQKLRIDKCMFITGLKTIK